MWSNGRLPPHTSTKSAPVLNSRSTKNYEMKVAHGHLMSAAACVHVGTGRDENIMPPLQSCRPCFALPVDEDRYSFLVEAVCLEVCT